LTRLLNYIKFIWRYLAEKLCSKLGIPNKIKRRLLFSLQSVLAKNFPPESNFSFILAGAHDGISHDFIFTFLNQRKISGIAIEPQPDQFKNDLTVNKELHPYLKEVCLYRVDPLRLTDLPNWADGIASLDKMHHQRSGIPPEFIQNINVPADSLMSIIQEKGFTKKIDYFQTDTEGFDFEVLKMIDFNKLSPDIIRFEYVNLSKQDCKAAKQLLKKKGYLSFHQDGDIIAIKPDCIKL
jgi:FkbM family methyltransferase